MDELVETALAAARAAGVVQRDHFGKLLNVDEKRKNDIKLEVDRLCEETIVNTIRVRHPEHEILAEEGGVLSGTGPCRWIIDPLDGTVNFYYGIPYFCTSIACFGTVTPATRTKHPEDYGTPLVGVVYAPLLDEMFLGVQGRGATLNDVGINASKISALSESMIATGFGSTQDGFDRLYAAQHGLASRVRKMRCLGAAAYDLCNVACGRLTGFVEKGLRTWDIAAAHLILTEAGAISDAIEYDEGRWDVVASGREIFREFSKIVREDNPLPPAS